MRKLAFLPLLGLTLACIDSTPLQPPDDHLKGVPVTPAASTTLFMDDFEDGDAQGWDLSGDGWTVETDAGNQVLSSSTENDFAFARLQHPGWYNFQFHTRVKFVSGNTYCELLFRIDEQGQHYWLQVTESGIALEKEDGTGAFEELARHEMSIQQNQWYDFEISAKNKKIKVYVNGSRKINAKDDDPFGNAGTVGFELHDNSQVYFDDVLVTGPSNEGD